MDVGEDDVVGVSGDAETSDLFDAAADGCDRPRATVEGDVVSDLNLTSVCHGSSIPCSSATLHRVVRFLQGWTPVWASATPSFEASSVLMTIE